jgi:hypothetical protein
MSEKGWSVTRYTGPPMTLGNMRANGVRRLDVSCRQCHHSSVLNVDQYGDDVPVPSFGPRMVCTYCGTIGGDARPNWPDQGSKMVAGQYL